MMIKKSLLRRIAIVSSALVILLILYFFPTIPSIDEDDFLRIYNEKKDEKHSLDKKIEEYKSKENKEVNIDTLMEDFLELKDCKKLIYSALISRIEIDENKNIELIMTY